MSLIAPAVVLQLNSVLVATDFSEASDKPLRYALSIARHYGAKFYLAHVVSSLGYTLAGPDAATIATDIAGEDARRLEEQLVKSGALEGLRHEVIVRPGKAVWEELENAIREEQVEMVVVGTHARRGLKKLVLGSVAEQIFHHADCLVLTVGPGSAAEGPIEGHRAFRPFLFATDFSPASLHALPYAISSANHFGTKLVLLHVLPPVPMPEGFHWATASDLVTMRENARTAAIRQLEDLTRNAGLAAKPEIVIEFGTACPVSEKILEVADKMKVDAILMGLNRSKRSETPSQMPWATAYDVVCRADCPVLTVRN